MDNVQITPPDTKELIAKSTDLQTKVASLEITDNPSYEQAGKLVIEIKEWIKVVEGKFQESCDAAFKAHRAITSFKNETLAPYEEALREANRLMGAYRLRVEEKRQEEQRRANEKAAQEAEEARKKEIKAAEKAGDKEGAKNLKQAPIIAQPAPIRTQEPPKVKGLTVRKVWDFSVENEAKIPRKFWTLDRVAIGKVVKALGDKHGIPGINAFQKDVQ